MESTLVSPDPLPTLSPLLRGAVDPSPWTVSSHLHSAKRGVGRRWDGGSRGRSGLCCKAVPAGPQLGSGWVPLLRPQLPQAALSSSFSSGWLPALAFSLCRLRPKVSFYCLCHWASPSPAAFPPRSFPSLPFPLLTGYLLFYLVTPREFTTCLTLTDTLIYKLKNPLMIMVYIPQGIR